MKHNPVGWFEIYVEDMERAKRFYESVFETRLESLGSPELEMWAFPMDFESTGCPGTLARMPGFSPGGNGTLVYFSCEDCAEEAQRVVDSGGRLQQEKKSIGEYGFMALAVDTEGNLIGLHSNR